MSSFTAQGLNAGRGAGESRGRGRRMRAVTALAAVAAVLCGGLASAMPASADGVTGEVLGIAHVPAGSGWVTADKRSYRSCDKAVDGVRVQTIVTFADARRDTVITNGVGCTPFKSVRAIVSFIVCEVRGQATNNCVGGRL